MVHQAVQDYRIGHLLEGAVEEVSKLLVTRHGISQEKQKEYSTKMISRFQNPRLPDNLMRITKDPKRKLGPSDRLIAPSRQALECGITPTFLFSKTPIKQGFFHLFLMACVLESSLRQN